MKIQYNTDKTISGEERNEKHFSTLIENGLKHFQSYITRVEVHLSDQNGEKEGPKDIKCALEARIEGRQPVAVSSLGDNQGAAVSAAISKLKNALSTVVGRMKEN